MATGNSHSPNKGEEQLPAWTEENTSNGLAIPSGPKRNWTPQPTKTWGSQQPQNTIREHGSQHGKTAPNSLRPRELTPDHKTKEKTYPIPLCGNRE